MRHLVVTNDFPPKVGGIESYVRGLCAGVAPEDVVVIAPARPGHEAVDRSLPYTVLRLRGQYMRASGRVAKAVTETVRTHGVEAVHFAHALPLGRLGSRVRKSAGVPVTIFTYGSEILVPGRMPFVRRALRKVLTEADLVFAASHFTERALRGLTRDRARVAVLHPTVDVERFSLAVSGTPVRERYGLGGRFVVLFVSRLVKRKGAEILARALAEVPEAVALIVGSGPEDASVRRTVSELGLSERVILAGPASEEELPSYYAAADVFCMPCTDRYGGADTEGFGIVYLEAAASGLPCIAGVCGGSVEAVEDGVTGALLSDPAPGDVARELRRLVRDEGLRMKLGAAGRERAVTRFSPSAQARVLDEEAARLRG